MKGKVEHEGRAGCYEIADHSTNTHWFSMEHWENKFINTTLVLSLLLKMVH